MMFFEKIKNLFKAKKDFVPIFMQQATFLCQTSDLLVNMLESTDPDEWKRCEKEIKQCEIQGDAILTEFHILLFGRIIGIIDKIDLQTIAMSMDDCVDGIKGAAKALLIYQPRYIDDHLKELAQLIKAEAYALKELLPRLTDIKHETQNIILQCDRVTELEHAADETFEEYIGHICGDETDYKEMIKYKSLAEILENVTDSGKRVSDNVRKLLLKYRNV